MTIVSIFQPYVNGYYRLMATKHLTISYYDYGIVYYMDLMKTKWCLYDHIWILIT